MRKLDRAIYSKSYMIRFITVLIYLCQSPGYKSITVSENVYNKFFGVYERSKRELELKGITSFSGYLTSMMEEMMNRYEVFAKQAPFIEKVSIDGIESL